jgi:Family of unknown function (DUF6011)
MSPRREEALAVVCPRCGAMADEPCIGESGQPRTALHGERHQLASQLRGRRRRKRWSGNYIVVWSDNSWEFFRCCRCGKRLNDGASRQRGLGPECKDRAAVDEVMGIKEAERARMRAWLKQAAPRDVAERASGAGA